MPTFTPPTVQQPLHATDRLLSRYSIPVGQSVVKKGGVYTLMPYPWVGEIEGLAEGSDYFMGGRTYRIDDDIAAALENDGFTVNHAPLGYNEGQFDEGSYGQ